MDLFTGAPGVAFTLLILLFYDIIDFSIDYGYCCMGLPLSDAIYDLLAFDLFTDDLFTDLLTAD